MGDTAGDSEAATLATGVLVALAVVGLLDDAAEPFCGFDEEVGASCGGGCSFSSSGMGGQYLLRTCLRAGRRMGFDKKKSIPES